MSKPLTDRIQVKIPEAMRRDLEDLRAGKSVGPFVREALEEYLGHPEVRAKVLKNRRKGGY